MRRRSRRSGQGMEKEAMGKGKGRSQRSQMKRGGGRGGRRLLQRGAVRAGATMTTATTTPPPGV